MAVTVDGRIRLSEDDGPDVDLGGVRIKLFDRDFSKTQEVASTQTGADGRYIIAYAPLNAPTPANPLRLIVQVDRLINLPGPPPFEALIEQDHKRVRFTADGQTKTRNFNAVRAEGPEAGEEPPDLSFVKAVLSAALERVAILEADEKPVNDLRLDIRHFVAGELTKPGDPALIRFSVPLEVIEADLREFADYMRSKTQKMMEQKSPEESSTGEDHSKDIRLEAMPIEFMSIESYLASLALTCVTCRNRYYTPGTIYYMNYTAYVTCCNNPPCTPP